jgi:hypothetical protein
LNEIWISDAYRLLSRCEKSYNGQNYSGKSQILLEIQSEVEDWMSAMEQSIAGEKVASFVITVLNQLDDRFITFN